MCRLSSRRLPWILLAGTLAWSLWLGVARGASGGDDASDEEVPAPPKVAAAAGGDSTGAKTSDQAAPETAADDDAARTAQIAQWIQQLGDDDFYTREAAQRSLAEAGFEAFEALTAATANDDLEVASRAKQLLRRISVDWLKNDDPPEVRKLLADYDSLNSVQRVARMKALADLPDDAGAAALFRLACFEKSTLLSKRAALSLMGDRPGQGRPPQSLADILRERWTRSSRPAVLWLRAWLSQSGDPRVAAIEWQRHAELEERALQRSPDDTSPAIVAALMRYQIAWLKESGQNAETLRVMRSLVALEQGDPQSLLELMDWLIEQQAWPLIDETARRFQTQFHEYPLLLYTAAQAKLLQGEAEAAGKIADEAAALDPGLTPEEVAPHLYTARALRKRGLFDWAQREFVYVADRSPAASPLRLMALSLLSEMAYDNGDGAAAADWLQKVVDATDNRTTRTDSYLRRELGETISRVHFLRACGYRDKNDDARYREELAKAMEQSAMDIDAIIVCSQLGGWSAEQQRKLDQHLAESTANMQEFINGSPDQPELYNQYAWLVGNTSKDREGLKKALNYSQRSLDLSPGNGAYLDTLAHIYFRLGDYDNAVSCQKRAVRAEPHSGLLRRALAEFTAKQSGAANDKPAAGDAPPKSN